VAGLRTHVIVGVGSTLFTLVSAYAFEDFLVGGPGAAAQRVDPTRIAAQIVSGIGFLGAGAIIRQGANVRGLTTAAALWIAAAIGMAVGAGYYFGASIATALVLISLVGGRYLRPAVIHRFGPPRPVVTMELEVDPSSEPGVGGALDQLIDQGAEINAVRAEEPGRYSVSLRPPRGVSPHELVSDVASAGVVRSARLVPG
jgi:putative Mg2+ transporter-C (MgtC) family protein